MRGAFVARAVPESTLAADARELARFKPGTTVTFLPHARSARPPRTIKFRFAFPYLAWPHQTATRTDICSWSGAKLSEGQRPQSPLSNALGHAVHLDTYLGPGKPEYLM